MLHLATSRLYHHGSQLKTLINGSFLVLVYSIEKRAGYTTKDLN